MSAVDRALKDLMNKTDLDIMKKTHSKGTLYRALDKYEKEVEKRIQRIREQERKHLSTESQAKQRSQQAVQEQEAYVKANKGHAKINQQLALQENTQKQRLATTTKHLEEKRVKLAKVEASLEKLAKRNLSQKVMEPILRSDIGSPEELVTRIKTKKEYLSLQNENRNLRQNVATLNMEKSSLEKKWENLRQEVTSEALRFDELKMTHRLWVDSISVVNKAQGQGYTPSILLQVLRALFKLSEKGQPLRSVKRFLRRLEKIAQELELDASIEAKVSALNVLESRYNEVVANLEAVSNGAVAIMNKTEKAAITVIGNTSRTSAAAIKKAAGQGFTSIQGVEQVVLSSLQNELSTALSTIKQLEANIVWFHKNQNASIARVVQDLRNDVQGWGDIRAQAGRIGSEIKMGTTFMGLLHDPQAILNMHPSLVVRLAERIHIYANAKWPTVKTKASRELSNNNWGINSLYDTDLCAVSWWLVEALRTQEREN